MTMGMILFGAGAACLVLTIVLIVVFCLKPPKYRPENEAVAMAGSGQTQPLRGGYQTNRLAMSRSLQTAGMQTSAQAPGEVQAAAQVVTAPIPGPLPGTVPLPASGVPAAQDPPPPQEPAAAWQGAQAAQPAPGTVVLGAPPEQQTVFLGAAQSAPGTMVLGTPPEQQTVFLGAAQPAPGTVTPGGAPNEALKAP